MESNKSLVRKLLFCVVGLVIMLIVSTNVCAYPKTSYSSKQTTSQNQMFSPIMEDEEDKKIDERIKAMQDEEEASLICCVLVSLIGVVGSIFLGFVFIKLFTKN